MVVAGDFCDSAPFPYEGIREVLGEFPDLHIWILIGNHDLKGGVLSDRFIGLEQVRVVDRPMLLPGWEVPILLLPYRPQVSMSQALYEAKRSLGVSSDYLLISHGEVLYTGDYYDDEGYFPITPAEVRALGPRLSVLGHIHSGPEYPDLNLFYCGSLFPLTTNELGPRRYGVVEPVSGAIEWVTVQEGPLYWRDQALLLGMDRLEETLERLWAGMERVFSSRRDWKGDLRLRVGLECISADEAVVRERAERFFAEKGISKVEVSAVAVDIPERVAPLVSAFVEEVERLCGEENDAVPWGRYKEDIILRGMMDLRDALARLR